MHQELNRTKFDLETASHVQKAYVDLTSKTQIANVDLIHRLETQTADDLSTIQSQAETIITYKKTMEAGTVEIKELSDEVSSYASKLSSANSKITSLNKDIENLEDALPVKIKIENNFYHNQFVVLDKSIYWYVPRNTSRSFYVKPGSYSMAACHPNIVENLSKCANWGNKDLTYDRTITITP